MNPGKNVGRVSIRVVPDTTRFHSHLRKDLAQIERTTAVTIRVTPKLANLTRIRDDIRRQVETFDGMTVDVKARILPELSRRHRERFHRDVRAMVDRAKQNVDIGVAAHTAAAAAQLRYTARPRWVDIFVRVNQASVAKALTTLAALSGARLTWNWIDTLIEKASQLDKNLPSILGWTSGITALIAAIAGSVSGLVGLGQGLFSITPALLTLPGLFLNALGSLTVLIVALKHSREELGELAGDMNELGSIMRTTFWQNARQPIVSLVQGLMPQLRNSFRELAQGVGEFTGALADAFGEELAGGRLEGIFAGIAEGWRILGTGASGFAGALVNLSEIAARYTPRLASWFVRQANTFDNFLSLIATDGRLESWMEGAIDSMYDLWDATRGFSGVLAGIWTAADSAGSGGLKGFAQMMLEWREIVNSADFQRGLTAVFRGSYVAMDAFGGAIESIGRLIGDMPGQFERFIGSAGGFLGGLIEGAFDALNNSNFRIGLDGLSEGFDDALAGILPSLDPIAETFGDFLGLLGDIAGTLLPAAAGAFADLMPAVQGIIDAVRPVLQPLADAVTDIANSLGPVLADFVEAASPVFQDIVSTLATAVTELVDGLGPLLDFVTDLVRAIGDFSDATGAFFDGVREFMGIGSSWKDELSDLVGGNVRSEGGFVLKWFDDATGEDAKVQARNWANAIADEYQSVLDTRGPEAAAAFVRGLADINLPPEVRAALLDSLPADSEWGDRGRQGGGGFSRGLAQGITASQTGPLLAAIGVKNAIVGAIPAGILNGVGGAMMDGLAAGIRVRAVAAKVAAIAAAYQIVSGVRAALQINSPSRVMANRVGRWIPEGIALGIDQHAHVIGESARNAVTFGLGNPFGGSSDARISAGNTIHVTQPLLPGETPQEQRDNLVRELALIH